MKAAAAEANYYAVAALREGKTGRAVDVLCQTLHGLASWEPVTFMHRNVPHIPAEIRKERTLATSETSCSPFPSSLPPPPPSELTRVLIEAVPLPETLTQQLMLQRSAVFSFAFLLPSEGLPFKQTQSILLFNLALVYHVVGVETGNSVFLSTALTMYHHSYAMIDEETLSSRNVTGFVGIIAALYYNMAHIYGEFWLLSEARFLRSKLKTAVHSTGFTVSSHQAFAFFHVNLFLNDIEDFRLAPAA